MDVYWIQHLRSNDAALRSFRNFTEQQKLLEQSKVNEAVLKQDLAKAQNHAALLFAFETLARYVEAADVEAQAFALYKTPRKGE